MSAYLPVVRLLRRTRILGIAIAALSLSACGWDCGTLLRTIANGTLRDAAGVTLATVQAEVREDVPTFLHLSVGVIAPPGAAGAPLRGHVTRARLLTETGELLAEIPTGTSTLYSEAVVALNVQLPSRAEYDRMRGALHTNRTKVVLNTDLPGLEAIETTLQGTQDIPGEVSRCSPA